MKTAVVISDSHGNISRLNELKTIFAESDYIIHLGDTSSDGSAVRSEFHDKTTVINGNCDFIKLGEDEAVIEIENVKIFAAHGHLYSVKSTLSKLAARAKELNCSIALYGHTHSAREDVIGGVTLINPGNLSKYSRNSYCYLVINGDKAVAKTVLL